MYSTVWEMPCIKATSRNVTEGFGSQYKRMWPIEVQMQEWYQQYLPEIPVGSSSSGHDLPPTSSSYPDW